MMKLGAAALALAALSIAAPAQARVLDHIQLTLGVSGVLPEEKGSPIPVSISNEYVPSLQVEYFFNDNISAELLCCVATHDVRALGGAVNLGTVTHFPPTVTLKYHWTNLGQFQPYVGAGVNYTAFIATDPPAGRHVHYDSSFGGALQAGFDYRLNDHWAINADVRKIWISTDVRITGDMTASDSVDINPWVVTTGVAYRF